MVQKQEGTHTIQELKNNLKYIPALLLILLNLSSTQPTKADTPSPNWLNASCDNAGLYVRPLKVPEDGIFCLGRHTDGFGYLLSIGNNSSDIALYKIDPGTGQAIDVVHHSSGDTNIGGIDNFPVEVTLNTKSIKIANISTGKSLSIPYEGLRPYSDILGALWGFSLTVIAQLAWTIQCMLQGIGSSVVIAGKGTDGFGGNFALEAVGNSRKGLLPFLGALFFGKKVERHPNMGNAEGGPKPPAKAVNSLKIAATTPAAVAGYIGGSSIGIEFFTRHSNLLDSTEGIIVLGLAWIGGVLTLLSLANLFKKK